MLALSCTSALLHLPYMHLLAAKSEQAKGLLFLLLLVLFQLLMLAPFLSFSLSLPLGMLSLVFGVVGS